MKLFNDIQVSTIDKTESSTSKSVSSTGSKGPVGKRSNKIKPERKNISESEIREKLASNVELSNTAKQQVIQKNTQQLGSGFMNSEKPPVMIARPVTEQAEKANVEEEKSDDPNFKDHLVKSDVGTNSPSDPATSEKLKTVLSKGAFNFNPKEREALDRILQGN